MWEASDQDPTLRPVLETPRPAGMVRVEVDLPTADFFRLQVLAASEGRKLEVEAAALLHTDLELVRMLGFPPTQRGVPTPEW